MAACLRAGSGNSLICALNYDFFSRDGAGMCFSPDVAPVRRQGFWDRCSPELREDLAHVVRVIEQSKAQDHGPV